MIDNLEQSLDELNALLSELKTEGPIDPHAAMEVAETEEHNDYCIKNGSYVRISEDNMSAWLYLNQPGEGEEFYHRTTILEFLRQHNIVKGYHSSNISAIAKKHVYEREILVAKGEEPVSGKNGYYEFKFEQIDHRVPKIREDGSVDYSSMTALTNVNEGDVVAIYHHAEQGKNGFDVLGNVIKTTPSRELPPLRGRSIMTDGDPDVYLAMVSGKIEYKDNRIDIKNVHEVQGDVDLITGKVEFFGDIHISGNVERGVVIRASRNITIDGVVEAATIYAGGDITIARGIQGGQKAKITAKGDVSADFIEHCTIEAGGNVRANTIINSEVDAHGMVIADGKKTGAIFGGRIRGLKGISAQFIGNDSEIKTEAMAGYMGEEYATYLEAFQKETDTQKQLAATVDEMTKILKDRRMGRDSNPDLSDKKLLVLNEDKDNLFKELDTVRQEKERLSQIIEEGKGSTVVVNDTIYRGVTICVEGTVFAVPASTRFMKYKNEGGRVVTSVVAL